MAPLPKPILHDEVHRYARHLVRRLAEQDPKHYMLSSQGNRRGRKFLDYLRNGRGTTAVGTYSPRENFRSQPRYLVMHRGRHRPDAFTMKSPSVTKATLQAELFTATRTA